MNLHRYIRQGVLLALCLSTLTATVRAQATDPGLRQECIDNAVKFLRTTQSEDGSWTTNKNAGINGLVVTSLLANGVSVDDPLVAKSLAHLMTYIQPDGGIYAENSRHRNYETCIAMMAFHKANASGKYTNVIANAEKFLRGLQWDEGEGLETTDPKYGGFGYGSHQRPDLSNTQFLLEALNEIGVAEDDPAIQKALIFVSRTQNLESEHNTTPFASKINDGGFFYTIAAGGETKAETTANGGLESYGSMTYAGLKSMIYAGLTKDDPRVKAATEWIRKHYTLEENPGVGQQGLFYYYHTFARTLAVMEVDEFEDASGVKHQWRQELVQLLHEKQKSNGSWLNPADRWMEGDPNLVTAYTLLALESCK